MFPTTSYLHLEVRLTEKPNHTVKNNFQTVYTSTNLTVVSIVTLMSIVQPYMHVARTAHMHSYRNSQTHKHTLA